MMSGHGTVETAVEATRLGAFDFVEKPLSLQKLLRTVERALDAGKRKRQSGKLLPPRRWCRSARASVMQQLRAELQQIAGNASPVLLVGEPGTGREAFARFIHEQSPRASAAVRHADREHAARRRRRAGAVRHRDRRAGRARRAGSAPVPARCSSTRSRTCRRRRSVPCSACSRAASSRASAAARR